MRMLDVMEQVMRRERPAPPKHANPMGTLHRGILADIAMGMAYASRLEDGDFTKPVWLGKLRTEGRVLAGGRSVGLVECDVRDMNDRLVATRRGRA